MLTCRCGRPSEVTETRTAQVGDLPAVRRRRRCTDPDCAQRWTTYEVQAVGSCQGGGETAAILGASAVVALRTLLEQMRLLCDALEPLVGQPVMAPLSAAAERAADALAS